jgi:hypothetical protein
LELRTSGSGDLQRLQFGQILFSILSAQRLGRPPQSLRDFSRRKWSYFHRKRIHLCIESDAVAANVVVERRRKGKFKIDGRKVDTFDRRKG